MPFFWKGEKPKHPYLEYTCRFPGGCTDGEFFSIVVVLGLFVLFCILTVIVHLKANGVV